MSKTGRECLILAAGAFWGWALERAHEVKRYTVCWLSLAVRFTEIKNPFLAEMHKPLKLSLGLGNPLFKSVAAPILVQLSFQSINLRPDS